MRKIQGNWRSKSDRYCDVCGKPIHVYQLQIGGTSSWFGSYKRWWKSDEGVLSPCSENKRGNSYVWFCNDCWDEIMEVIKPRIEAIMSLEMRA